MTCEHETLKAAVDIERGPDGSVAKLRITCGDCGAPMIFPGLDAGRSTERPMASADGTEARLPITFADQLEQRCPHCEAILFGPHVRPAERPEAVDCGADHQLLYSDGQQVCVSDSGNWVVTDED
jgi:hypothetical protein